MTLPLTAFAASSVKTFADFNKGMIESEAVFRNVSAEMRNQLQEVATVTSTQTVHSADELARAYTALARAGVTAERSLERLPVVAAFAQAGVVELDDSVELMTTAFAAMGDQARKTGDDLTDFTRMANLLVKASIISETEITDLATAITRKAGQAMRRTNRTMEEGVALLALLGKTGLRGAIAGERFDIILRELHKSLVDNVDAWKRLGIVQQRAELDTLSLAEIFRRLEQSLAGRPEVEQYNLLKNLLGFQHRSVSATLAVLDLSDMMDMFHNQLLDTGDVLGEVSAKQLQAFINDMERLRNRVQIGQRAIGAALVPILRTLMRIVARLGEAFAALPKWIQVTLVGIGALASALGPVIVSLGMLIFFGGEVTKQFPKIRDAVRGATSAIQENAAAAETAAAANTKLAASQKAVQSAAATVTPAGPVPTPQQLGVGQPRSKKTGQFVGTSQAISSGQIQVIQAWAAATKEQEANLKRLNRAADFNLGKMKKWAEQSDDVAAEVLGVGEAARNARAATASMNLQISNTNKWLAQSNARYSELRKQMAAFLAPIEMGAELTKEQSAEWAELNAEAKSLRARIRLLTKEKEQFNHAINEMSILTRKATRATGMDMEMLSNYSAVEASATVVKSQFDGATRRALVSQEALTSSTRKSTLSTIANATATRLSSAATKAATVAHWALTPAIWAVNMASRAAAVGVKILTTAVKGLIVSFLPLLAIAAAVGFVMLVKRTFEWAVGLEEANRELENAVQQSKALLELSKRRRQEEAQEQIADISGIEDLTKRTAAMDAAVEEQVARVRRMEEAAKRAKEDVDNLTVSWVGFSTTGAGTRGSGADQANNLEFAKQQAEDLNAQLDQEKDILRGLTKEQENMKEQFEDLDTEKMLKGQDMMRRLAQETELLDPALTAADRGLLKISQELEGLAREGIPNIGELRVAMMDKLIAETEKRGVEAIRDLNQQIALSAPGISEMEKKALQFNLELERMVNQGELLPDQVDEAAEAMLKLLQQEAMSNFTDKMKKLNEQIHLLGSPEGRREGLSDMLEIGKMSEQMRAAGLPAAELNARIAEMADKMREIRELKMFDKMRKDAESIKDAIKTPREKYQEEIDRIDKLMKTVDPTTGMAFLSPEEASRARRAARKEFLGAGAEGGPGLKPGEGLGAPSIQTQQGMKIVADALRRPTESPDTIELKKQSEDLDNIRRAIEKIERRERNKNKGPAPIGG